MRVLAAIVVPPHLSVSGAARAAESLSAALAARCTITVASMMGTEPARPADQGTGTLGRAAVATSLPLPPLAGALPQRVRTLFYRSDIPDLVRSGAYDLVHIHNPMPALEMGRIADACRASGLPYVVSTHGFNEIANGLRIYGFGRAQRLVWRRLVLAPVRRAVAHAARIFALSPADVELVQALGRPGGGVTVVPNGVPAPAIGGGEADERRLRGLGIVPRAPGAPPTFLFLANHTPNKGLPVLLEAFARLEEPFQLIVGGDKRPGIAYGEAIARCRPSQSIAVTGRLADADVAACFRRADAFVFPTLADTFPLVVLEAMANRLPVVASRVGGIPHQIGPTQGILVEPGDPGALAAALRELIGDPTRRAAMGAASQARVATEFTWDRAAEIAVEGYRQVLAEWRRARAAPDPARPGAVPSMADGGRVPG